jgi:hypothetical protein
LKREVGQQRYSTNQSRSSAGTSSSRAENHGSHVASAGETRLDRRVELADFSVGVSERWIETDDTSVEPPLQLSLAAGPSIETPRRGWVRCGEALVAPRRSLDLAEAWASTPTSSPARERGSKPHLVQVMSVDQVSLLTAREHRLKLRRRHRPPDGGVSLPIWERGLKRATRARRAVRGRFRRGSVG